MRFEDNDLIDYTLVGGFAATLLTMLYMFVNSQPVPALLEQIFWTTAVCIGLKKSPSNYRSK